MDYNAAKIYINVVEQGSFSGAAKVLNMPVSTVSRKVSELEESLELRLLERSTRQLRLTEAGEVFHEYAKQSIQEAEAGLLAVKNKQEELQGTLRISLPMNFEPFWPIIDSFQSNYPKVNLAIQSYPGAIDFIHDGIDVAMVAFPIVNPNYIVRDLGGARRIVVASPEYLKQNGTPSHPSELSEYRCISVGTIRQDISWVFEDKLYPINPTIKSNDFRMIKYLALKGKGIANLPPAICKKELDNGSLIELFESHAGDDVRFQLVYPSKILLSSITRAFINFCLNYIKSNDEGKWLKTVDMP